ncbi:hypothetical protein [Vibrio sp. AND4]|uniref:hypothetical protein n=1 Tax=Vibrio sp. AND4 TaxID=314289 RepID=UPI00015F30BC|nr:hypothetical protein [Vibrio sp. AND4]EDP60675.1 hypothetical protein AND4_07144 [Vibrio sp. AND4]
MKLITLSILALTSAASAVQAEQKLLQQPTPELFVASDSVKINGQDYRKLSVDSLAEVAELHAGDEVFKSAFSHVSKATGLIFVTVKNRADAKAVAQDLKLEVVFARGESAVFKASDDQDLLGISDYLNADSRVQASKIELNSGKYHSQ